MGKLTIEGGGEVLTSSQVSARIGLEASWVRRLCEDGRFPGAFKLSNRWFVPESGLAEYLEHPDKRRKRT